MVRRSLSLTDMWCWIVGTYGALLLPGVGQSRNTIRDLSSWDKNSLFYQPVGRSVHLHYKVRTIYDFLDYKSDPTTSENCRGKIWVKLGKNLKLKMNLSVVIMITGLDWIVNK